MLQVSRQVLTNRSALFQSRMAMLLCNFFITSSPDSKGLYVEAQMTEWLQLDIILWHEQLFEQKFYRLRAT